MKSKKTKILKNTKIDIKIKLAALWLIFMFLYIYTDFYKLYLPKKIEEIMAGKIDEFDITQMSLLLIAIVTIIPACMIYLSLIMNAKSNRLLNIIFGIFHLAIGIVNIIGTTWHFYMFYGALLIIVSILIVLTAWKWPIEIDTNNI
ncbi:DUF6326 family protein [Aquimarina sp. 2201CG14-23]|uniref:DUF6326 family protein n=1 Tax=Aquimarina mycalae TaxID=3040073 RepID=UPI002477F4F9|nr:DUF6326 family protein [Aquimarina sp. 2201CG14-23]MDH7445983.1 DUF6326 family protein [Aquimarina sp. 2201CG14-23]